MRVGEQHGQPVDTDSFTGRRRQAVAQRADSVEVHFLRRLLAAPLHLFEEALLLLGGIVQLGEDVAQLESAGKEIETLDYRRIAFLFFFVKGETAYEIVQIADVGRVSPG